MERINVFPLKGFEGLEFGDVEFGMDRETVRSRLGKYTEFKKSEDSENTTDDFGFCHVYYDSENRLIDI